MQRCTVHKTVNVLNKLPKSFQPRANRVLHDIWQAPTRADADMTCDLCLVTFEAKYSRYHRVSEERPHRTARVLRLPCTELVSHSDHQSDRKHIRHNPTATDQRLRFGNSGSNDDAQAGSVRDQGLEKNTRSHAPQKPSPRSSFHRRMRTNTRSNKRSCNVPQEPLHPKKPPPESNLLKPQQLTATLACRVVCT